MSYIITESKKSHGMAILWVLLVGPIGLFYASTIGGLIMTFGIPAILIALGLSKVLPFELWFAFVVGIGILYYLICLIWAVIAVSNFNKNLERKAFDLNKISNDSENYYSQYYSNKDKSIWPYILMIIVLLFAVGYIIKNS